MEEGLVESSSMFELRYRVVVPMFLSEPSPASVGWESRLRAASVKGALRYWWRVLASAQHDHQIEAISAQERALFGGPGVGRAAFFLELDDVPRMEPGGVSLGSGPEQLELGDGGRYLGYGLWKFIKRKRFEGHVLREGYLRSGSSVTMRVRMAPWADDAQRESLLRACRGLGMLGALGSRRRHGFGSLAWEGVRWGDGRLEEGAGTLEELVAQLEALLEGAQRGVASEHEAFSEQSRVLLLPGKQGESALELLDRFGEEMLRYRSWGRGGRVLGRERAERNFREDYRLIKRSLGGRRVPQAPDRIAFGLPQSYYLSSQKGGCTVRPLEQSRRAGPMWVHVHMLADRPVLVVSYLPGSFLPEQEKVTFCRSEVSWEKEDFWSSVEVFLERLREPGGGVEQFEGARCWSSAGG